ncbi:hypothetical protein FHG87_021606 [Trinorchestia longiramus]|nr:hypothetical protein FHG87_021606 [Trinorchestia longiramus]
MENGFDMTIINERDMLDDDPENVSAAVEDDVSPDGSGHVSDSVSRPVISHLLQNTEVPGNFRSRLLANMAGCKNKGRLVPRVNINADCSAAAIAALLASQKSTDDCHRSEADEILNSSSFSDEELSEESLNDFQSRYPNLFAADCKLATLDFTDRATQNAEVGRTVDPTWSPSPLQGLSLIDSDSVFSSGERDSNPDGNGNKSDSNSKNGGRGKRSISRSKHPVSEKILEANNAQTEVSDSLGSVEPNGNAKFSSTNEDPLEGPSWLYSSEAPSACCSFNQETSNFATRSGKSSSKVQCSNEAYDDGLFVDANNVRDTPSTLATTFESGKQCESSDIQQSNCINSTNLPQLRVEENSENFDSENIPDIQEPLQGPFRKNSLAHRGRGRKSKIEASCSLKEATVLQRNVESPLDNATHISSKETEEASTSACSGTHAFPRNVATGRANGKSQLKLEDLPRCKKAVVDETCLEEEPMEMTLPIPSSNSSDFLQSFMVNKHNQNRAMKSVNKTAGKDGVSLCDIVEVTNHSRAKSLRGAKGKPNTMANCLRVGAPNGSITATAESHSWSPGEQ